MHNRVLAAHRHGQPHRALAIGIGRAEAVALAIAPYPRAPGAEFAGVGQDAAEDEAGEKKKPFSALAALRERMERGEES